ncbi:hypothetical protein CIK05_01155 [Bdellovibrio sp. qaytius]|nr:hypothetical protein CIK05_01155 [Bdellovibrio sp. qaytius]
MANVIEDFFKSVVHHEALPLEEVYTFLDEALQDQMEFIPLMERHHGHIEESIAVLMSKDALEMEKQDHLFRFFRLLEMHGKAEEEVLYTALQHNSDKSPRVLGFAALDEHDLAFRLERELLEMGYRDSWNDEIEAKAKVVANLVRNHIKEEENEIFPLAEKLISTSHLELMSMNYIEKCKIYLNDSLQTSISRPVVRTPPAGSMYPH